VTDEKLDEIDYRVLGPELLAHHQVNLAQNADTTAAGNPRLAEKVKKKTWKAEWNYQAHEEWECAKIGWDQSRSATFSRVHATLETMTADEGREGMNDRVEKVTSHRPRNLDSFIVENESVWKWLVLIIHRRQKPENSERFSFFFSFFFDIQSVQSYNLHN
jgi:hypothetical protein